MKKAKIICVLMCIVLVLSSLPLGASAAKKDTAPLGFTEYYIETYEDLITYANSPYDEKILILQNDIIQIDDRNSNEIVVTNNSTINIDLNGYTLTRKTSGNDQALFRIKPDATLVVYDSSSAQTGTCIFSEGYATYQKAVFLNDGGELQIHSGSYEILSPHQQGSCSVIRTTSGLTRITGGTFDSSTAWDGDTISVGHDAYLYSAPMVIITGGDFYGKYQSIDISPVGNYLGFGCLFPNVYIMGGNFYICNKGTSSIEPGFTYCNNGWGRVLVAEGTVFATSLNQSDQRYLPGVSKRLFSQTIDDFKGAYYEVTAPPMIMPLDSEKYDTDTFYYERLFALCNKALVKTYNEETYLKYKELFDNLTNTIDTICVSETQEESPKIYLENRTDKISYIRWYMCDENDYNGANTQWTYLGNFDDVVQMQLENRPEYAQDILLRCAVTYSDLSTYEDIVRISYDTLKTAETVESFEITDLTVPAVGDTPDFNLTPAQDSYYINNVYWADITESSSVTMKETDPFKAGHKYRLEVWLRASEGYVFNTDEDDWIEATAKINGKTAEVAAGNSISAIVQIEFTMPEPKVIYEADVINIDTPYAGAVPDYDAFCTTQGCNVSSVKWYDVTDGGNTLLAEDDTFEEGRIYRVNVMLETEEGYAFLMVDRYNEATGYINGKRAIAGAADEDNWLQLGLIFSPCEENPNKPEPTEPSDTTAPSENTEPTESTATAPAENTEPTESTATAPSENTEPTESTATAPTQTAPNTPEVIGILGDADENGKVNVKDSTTIQKHIASLFNLSPVGELLADVDRNAAVNIKDATAIQKHIAGMNTGLAISEPVIK